jgi:hypothetical protein
MSAPLIPQLRLQLISGTGSPYSGALLYAYAAGTTTPQNTYSDSTLTTPNANPVVADSNGRFGAIYVDPTVAYKFVAKTSAGATIFTQDNVVTTGSNTLTVLSKTGNYVVAVTDGEDVLILADATAGGFTVTL